MCELSFLGLFSWFCGFFPLSLLSVLINFELSRKVSVHMCMLCGFLIGGKKHLCDCYNKDRIMTLCRDLSVSVFTELCYLEA